MWLNAMKRGDSRFEGGAIESTSNQSHNEKKRYKTVAERLNFSRGSVIPSSNPSSNPFDIHSPTRTPIANGQLCWPCSELENSKPAYMTAIFIAGVIISCN